MPQPLAALPEVDGEAAPHAGQVSDHRVAEGVTDDVAVLVEQLKAAVDSIPTYIERCAEMIVLTPSVKHADREGECCDFNSWRQRGWCRLEFVSSRLACRGDIPVMVITSREATPSYFNMCDTMKLFAGNGTFTVSDDKYKVKGVLETMLAAKAQAEFDKGNWGLARGHVLMGAAFLAGLPSEAETAAHERRAPRLSELSELAQLKKDFMWRDDATEAAWLKATGTSLLHVAAFSNKVEAVRELLATPEGKALLNMKIGNMMKLDRDAKLYKGQGSAINLKMQAAGLTPLSAAMASQAASPELIELLIDSGADTKGHVAFMMAVMQGSVRSMETYTKKLWGDKPGAPPWVNQSFMFAMGGTPLHASAFMSDSAAQKDKMVWLLDHGAAPSLKKTWMMGGSPLMALAGNPEADPACFDVLVAAGCDPNEVAKPWRLMKLVAGTLHLMKSLRPQKFSAADDFAMMASGGNPIHFASFIGNMTNIKKLAEHGASNDKKNRYGQLPIDTLMKTMPDSHAPELLGSAILPPDAKLRAAGIAIAMAAKLNKSARVMPNQTTTVTAVVP